MTQDLESRLRETLASKANAIAASDLRQSSPHDAPAGVLEADEHPSRRRPLVLAMAAVALATGLTALVVTRDTGRQIDAPVAAGPATSTSPAGQASRAWPLNGDEPLPAPTPEDPRTPDAVARSYLTEVVDLPADWPLQDLTHQDGTAVVDYVLQDVPSQVRLARADNDSWYVTSAITELARPELVGSTAAGIDVSVAPGPRTYSNGMNVRVIAVATDGRELARTLVRAVPPKKGEAGAAAIASLHWTGVELAAAVRADVLDDHDDDPTTPDAILGHWTVGVATPQPTGLPGGYDVLKAEAVHLGQSGDVDTVVLDYVRTRFPDYPSPGIEVEPARTRGRRAFARWEVREAETGGYFFLREADRRWDVIAATTDGMDLSQLRLEPGRVHGRVTTTNINSLFADVLLLDGSPVPDAPRPDGQPDAAYRFATAAGPANREVDIDVPVAAPTILRVGLVGGTILAVTEVRIA